MFTLYASPRHNPHHSVTRFTDPRGEGRFLRFASPYRNRQKPHAGFDTALVVQYGALMDDDANSTAALAVAIGDRVARQRQRRGWTLDQLAAAAGVSRRTIVNVEQGSANPSVGTLLKLGDALGVGLPVLVEPSSPRPLDVTRSGDGAVLWRGQAGGRGMLVAATDGPDVVELWEWTLGPNDRHDSDGHVAGTRELVHVVDGVVTVQVAGESVVLEAGDAVAFAGDAAHAYVNVGSEPARFALTVFEPRSEPTDA